jgi:c-di-GMP-binding flagellar brake protein YcgR
MNIHDDGGEWQRIAGDSQVLLRSRIEIGKFLCEITQRKNPLCAFFVGDEALFVSQLRYVDPQREYILIDYCGNRMANGALLSAEKTTFSCSHARGNIEFLATHFAEAMFEESPVVRLDFPDVLILMQRRAHRRIKTIPEVPLHCIVEIDGALIFECKIADISRGGLGTISYGHDTSLRPGMVLKNCKIIHPIGTGIKVDIEVRHCSSVVLADGTKAWQAGCSFVGVPSEIEEVIKVFILDLEKRETGSA